MKTDVTTATTPSTQPTPPAFNIGNLLKQDLGQLPVAIALIVMALYFNIDSHGLFLSARNLSNLVSQISVTATISLAAVLVLLIGEIDLSLAVVSNLCGAVMATLSIQHGFPWWAALLAGMLSGLSIGIINGIIVALIRVPSFIVTLAASFGYQGLLLYVLGANTTQIIVDPYLKGLSTKYLADYLGFLLPILGVALYGGYVVYNRIERQRQQLSVPPIWQSALTIGVVAALVGLALLQFESYLGVSIMVTIVIGLVTLFWIVMRFSIFGRYVYAIGGNAEASRRAGINVNTIRIAIFGLASMLAAVGGILAASRSSSADAQVDPTLLLQAIAAAVIGGVSLFGGRGSVWGVVMGALVIGGLVNGLILQGRAADIQYMAEGIVLILAVILDALLRRRTSSGR